MASIGVVSLKERLRRRPILIAPGVYDALTASIAEAAGFEALYLSGAALAYTRLGRPDIGLVSMDEVAGAIALIADRTGLPLIVDADTGYGNALNVKRTMRLFERAGAGAIQIEDQTFPKRCGHLADKSLVAATEMAGKIKAAVDARASSDTLVIARTDAVAVEGLEAALDRAARYREAGADVLFVEAPKSLDQLAAVAGRLGDALSLMANMVEGGQTPVLPAAELEKLGYSLVIFPGGIVRAIVAQARDFYGNLKATGSTAGFRDRMLDFEGLNRLLGTAALIEEGKAYERAPGDAA